MADVSVDAIIKKLLDVRGKKKDAKVNLAESEIKYICHASREVLLSQPMLLEIEAPLNICGDVHGYYFDLLRIFEHSGYPSDRKYLFLGDYVDRGTHSLETICLLLAYKIKYPDGIYLLRGNHECASINQKYGFYNDCKTRYNTSVFKMFTDCFNCLPVSAIVSGKIFCIHGGLSPDLESMEQIKKLARPTDVPDSGLMCDLLWSDPDSEVTGWGESERGVSFTFGGDIVSKFLQKHNLDLICRAHQVVEDGYEFFADMQLVTIFSAPDYVKNTENNDDMENSAGVMIVDKHLTCSFQSFKPVRLKQKYSYYGLKEGKPLSTRMEASK